MGILVRTIGTPAFIDRFAHALTKTNAGRASVDTFRAGASLPAALLTPDEALTDTYICVDARKVPSHFEASAL